MVMCPGASKAPKKIICLQILAIGTLLAFSFWLFTAFGIMTGQVTCFLDQIITLKNIEGEAGAQAASIAEMIPDSIISLVQTYVPLLAIIIIVPAVLIAGIEFLIVLCSCNFCKKSRMDEICAKFLILFLMFFLVIGFFCYIGIGAAGVAINQPTVQSMLTMVTDVCDEQVPEMGLALEDAQGDLDEVQVQLDAASALGASTVTEQQQVDDAQFELDEAGKAVEALDQVCGCIAETFDILPTFTIPGLGCAAGCVLLVLLNCASCCALGICGGKKQKPAKSDATEVQQNL